MQLFTISLLHFTRRRQFRIQFDSRLSDVSNSYLPGLDGVEKYIDASQPNVSYATILASYIAVDDRVSNLL